MNKNEKDIKTIVAVVLVLIVVIVLFFGIRSCSNQEETETPLVTPTPTETPEATPTPTPDPEEETESNTGQSTNSGSQMTTDEETDIEVVEPIVTPDPTPSLPEEEVDFAGLQIVLEEATSTLDAIEGCQDAILTKLLVKLSQLQAQGEVLLNTDTTQELVNELTDALRDLLVQVDTRIDTLIMTATELVKVAEDVVTEENVKNAQVAINALPNGEIKTNLQERLDRLEVPTTISYVTTFEELQLALANDEITMIEVENDITLTSEIVIDRALTLHGNGNVLSLATTEFVKGITVVADDVTISNLTVAMQDEAGWQGRYAIHVYDSKNVVLDSVSGTNADAAILVNASSVELVGTVDVSGNEFGGIEVSKGTAEGLENAILELTGNLINQTESYGKPSVWVVVGEGTFVGSDFTETDKVVEDQLQYYLDSANVTRTLIVTNENLEQLMADLKDGDTLVLQNDIIASKKIVIDHAITIVGNGNMLSGELEIIADDVVLQDIILDHNPMIIGNNVVLEHVIIQTVSSETDDVDASEVDITEESVTE